MIFCWFVFTLKGLRVMTLIFPTYDDFIKFGIFSTFLLIQRKPNQTIYIYKHLLKDSWMFLKHWAHVDAVGPALSRQSVLWVNPPSPPIIAFPDQLRAAAINVTMWLVWACRPTWSVFVVLVYMTIYVLKIELVSSFSTNIVSFYILIFYLR